MILVSIVLTFLVCHTFRLVIQAYEVTHPSHSTAEHHGFCNARGRSVYVYYIAKQHNNVCLIRLFPPTLGYKTLHTTMHSFENNGTDNKESLVPFAPILTLNNNIQG